MKFIIFSLCLSAFYLQSTSAGVIDNVAEDFSLQVDKLKSEVENEIKDMIEPILVGAKKIEDRFIAYQIRQSEIEEFSIFNMNYSACLDLGSTIENSSSLAINISTTAYQIVMNITDSFNKLSSGCASWNPYTAVKCYISNIDTIKNEIEEVKPLIKLYENIVMALVQKVEDQFLTCIGDEPQPTVAPTQKPTEAPKPSPTEPPKPTEAPKPAPTEAPKPAPTEAPKPAPTEAPKPAPTEAPKPAPTEAPKPAPTEAPKPAPTEAPKPSEATTKSTNDVVTTTTKKPWWHFW